MVALPLMLVKLLSVLSLEVFLRSSAYVITANSLRKTSFPTGFDFTTVSGCPSTIIKAQIKQSCSGSCLNDPICTGYQFTAPSTCQKFSYALGSPMAPSNSNTYFAITTGGGGVDVARGKTATTGNTYPGYPGPQSTLSGIVCGLAEKQCWSSLSPLYASTLKIDLGATFNIRRIVVTKSSFWPNYIVNTFVHVGNTGTASDPQFGAVIGNVPGTKIQLTGNLSGRYIMLERISLDTTFCLALCLVEAFES